MRRILAVLALSAFALSPAGLVGEARADCAEQCDSACGTIDSRTQADDWAACMEPCLKACLENDPPDVPDVPPPEFVSCPGGSEWDPDQGACYCPEGTGWDGNACVEG